MSDKLPEFLAHHAETSIAQAGVKGMKWGVRKDRRSNKRPQTKEAADANRLSKRIKKNGLGSLSNSELQRLNKRRELESKYIKSKTDVIDAGKKHIDRVVAVGSSVTALYALANTPWGKAAINRGKQAINLYIRKLPQITAG